jgi:HAE1 family hydrophobic/amphiphilic exporter-1
MKLLRKSLFFAINTVAFCLLLTSGIASAQEGQIARINAETAAAPKQGDAVVTESTGKNSFSVNASRVGVQTISPLTLSLGEAIRKALENNNDVEISRHDVRFAETSLRSLLGIYDPVFTVSPTFTRNQTTGGTATKDFNINSNFTQFIRPGGGSYRAFFNNTRSENAFTQSQLTSGTGSSTSALFQSSLGISYTQPLFRNMKIDSARRLIKIQRKRLAQSDADFRRQTIETITQVQRTYWDLVYALRNQQNQMSNIDLAKENLRQIEAKIDAGTEAPLARFEVETELANRESDLLVAAQQVSIFENTLKQLMLKDPAAPEWTVALVPTDKPVFSLDSVSLDDAMKDALANRYELRRLKLQKEINEIDISYFKNQVKPQIDLNSTFNLGGIAQGGANGSFNTNFFTSATDLALLQAINDTRTAINTRHPGFMPTLDPIPNSSVIIPAGPDFLFGGFNRSLANLFRSDAPNFSVGVTISFPLRNKTAKADLAGARVQEDQIAAQTRSQEQVVVVEVRNAVQAVETSKQRVLTARRARENAQKQLEGEQDLYEAGKSTTFILFQRENTLNAARNAEIRAETDYNKALSDLQRATSTTFRINNIEVTSPVDDN